MEARKAYLFHGATPVTSIPTGEYDSRDGKLRVLSRVDDDACRVPALPDQLDSSHTNNLLPQGPHEYDNVHIRPLGIECGHSRCIMTTRFVTDVFACSGRPRPRSQTDHGPITVTSVVHEDSFSYPPYFWVKTREDAVDTWRPQRLGPRGCSCKKLTLRQGMIRHKHAHAHTATRTALTLSSHPQTPFEDQL